MQQDTRGTKGAERAIYARRVSCMGPMIEGCQRIDVRPLWREARQRLLELRQPRVEPLEGQWGFRVATPDAALPESMTVSAPGVSEVTVPFDWSGRYAYPRPFLRCPVCGRRCVLLYLCPRPWARRWACRKCLRLRYRSQMEYGYRAWRERRRTGGSSAGAHSTTLRALLQRAEDLLSAPETEVPSRIGPASEGRRSPSPGGA
jgi:hypothetical protein